mmetsp:Transcript_18490/g.46512  ORF Transcript_18490/g.46512 Transcript_18490/m.46512 type:complete len:106 (-) Transcript_18490:1770-2087(-)
MPACNHKDHKGKCEKQHEEIHTHLRRKDIVFRLPFFSMYQTILRLPFVLSTPLVLSIPATMRGPIHELPLSVMPYRAKNSDSCDLGMRSAKKVRENDWIDPTSIP